MRVAMLAAVGLVWAIAGTGLDAQAPVTKTMLIEPPTQLVPQRFGAWERNKSDTDGSLAAAYDGATGTVLKEDGLLRFASSTYKRDGSGETILMKAFQFGDTTGAVAAYTYFRLPQGRPAPQLKLGPDASLEGNGLLFREGATVVVTDFNGNVRASDLAALTVALPKAIGPTATAPLLPTLLPAKGLDADSVRYALGPESYAAMGGVLPAQVVGFDKNAEAVTAKYKSGGVLTLLLYPTPQIAGEHARAIEAAINQAGAAAAAGTVKLRRERGQAILALDAIHNLQGLFARAAAGTVSHRAKIRAGRQQRGNLFLEKRAVAVIGLGREEFKGNDRLFCRHFFGVDVADESHG